MAHIISADTWFGMDLALRPPRRRLAPARLATRDRVWQPLATWYLAPMLYTALAAGLVCLLSGLLLGFASKYGVLR